MLSNYWLNEPHLRGVKVQGQDLARWQALEDGSWRLWHATWTVTCTLLDAPTITHNHRYVTSGGVCFKKAGPRGRGMGSRGRKPGVKKGFMKASFKDCFPVSYLGKQMHT